MIPHSNTTERNPTRFAILYIHQILSQGRVREWVWYRTESSREKSLEASDETIASLAMFIVFIMLGIAVVITHMWRSRQQLVSLA